MLRNETIRSATRIGRIAAVLMVPASASATVFEFDEEGIVTVKPAINYIQRSRMTGSQSAKAVDSAAIETNETAPSPLVARIPSKAITYVAFPAAKPTRHPLAHSTKMGALASPWHDAALAAADAHHIPPALFVALIEAESSFNPKAISPKGAIGLTQLKPGTARALGVDPHDPQENLTGGARYLRQQYERFGTWPLALAAYNAGPTRVARLGRIPNIPETKTFVARVLRDAGLEPSTITTASN